MGSLNDWLRLRPMPSPFVGRFAAMTSIEDMAGPSSRGLLMAKEFARTNILFSGRPPHLPHGWECGYLRNRVRARSSVAISSHSLVTESLPHEADILGPVKRSVNRWTIFRTRRTRARCWSVLPPPGRPRLPACTVARGRVMGHNFCALLPMSYPANPFNLFQSNALSANIH